MSNQAPSGSTRRSSLGRRNAVLLGAAMMSLAGGYLLLGAGSASAAAVLLVLGYCVLLPLGIAL